MKYTITQEQQIDATLLFATFRCFNEQLYMLKGAHAQSIKMKFNRLLKVSRQYENELVKLMGNSQELEDVYDVMMDVINDVKTELEKNIKEKNNAK